MKKLRLIQIAISASMGLAINSIMYYYGSQDIGGDLISWLTTPGVLLFYVVFPAGIHSGVDVAKWVFLFNTFVDSGILYIGIRVYHRRVASGAR